MTDLEKKYAKALFMPFSRDFRLAFFKERKNFKLEGCFGIIIYI